MISGKQRGETQYQFFCLAQSLQRGAQGSRKAFFPVAHPFARLASGLFQAGQSFLFQPLPEGGTTHVISNLPEEHSCSLHRESEPPQQSYYLPRCLARRDTGELSVGLVTLD